MYNCQKSVTNEKHPDIRKKKGKMGGKPISGDCAVNCASGNTVTNAMYNFQKSNTNESTP